MKKIRILFSRPWLMWLMPLFALTLTVFIFKKQMDRDQNPVEIKFDDALGIQAEKTPLRYRGVNIGYVKSVQIPDDQSFVIVNVIFNEEFQERFAVEGTRFWVVKPHVGVQGVSGIETLLEGSYIAVNPGPANAAPKLSFRGSAGSDENENMILIHLSTPHAGSLDAGDVIMYRGLRIGFVSKVTLARNAQSVEILGKIYLNYGRLLRGNAVFARKMAVQAKLGLFKSEIKIGSLDNLMNGGIELFLPDDPGPRLKYPFHFVLSDTTPKDAEKWRPNL